MPSPVADLTPICTAHAYQLLSLWQVQAPGTELAELADKVQGLPQHAKTVAHDIQQVCSISAAGTLCVSQCQVPEAFGRQTCNRISMRTGLNTSQKVQRIVSGFPFIFASQFLLS